jgi:hypothetical protein
MALEQIDQLVYWRGRLVQLRHEPIECFIGENHIAVLTDTDGYVAAAFTHRTSRAGDPSCTRMFWW